MNGKRLLENLKKYAKIGGLSNGGVHRLTLTKEDKLARDLLKDQMLEAGLEVKIDQLGNMFGIRKGSEKEASAVMIGSHLDTVGNGGKFDGSLGVLASLEVINTLNDKNITTKKPIVLANFTNEEGVRFTPDMMGSLVFSGQYPLEKALASKPISGEDTTLEKELNSIGYQGTLEMGGINTGHFLELHIEQGPVLETENLDIGIVTGVQGISWLEVIFYGEANHAGTTPMHLRKDTSMAAGEFIFRIKQILNEAGESQRGTVGIIETTPNLINVIPSKTRVTCDLRNHDNEILKKTEKAVKEAAEKIAKEAKLSLELNQLVRFDPVVFDDTIVNNIQKSVKDLGYSSKKMISGAGHDAQMMSAVCTSAMIFIPSVGGISHDPKEHSTDEAIIKGAEVLYETSLRLANT